MKVARYGISSVVSIIEDELIEHMRSYHCDQNNIPFQSIALVRVFTNQHMAKVKQKMVRVDTNHNVGTI